MPKKSASQAKKAVTTWLEEHCHKNPDFKRNLFILNKQKKYKAIANAIRKDYPNGKNETNFLDNSQHVLDIVKHLESFDFSSSSSTKGNQKQKRTLSEVDSSVIKDDIKHDKKKKLKNTTQSEKEKEKSHEEEFDEDEMTSFLDKEDDDMMKRFYAVSETYPSQLF